MPSLTVQDVTIGEGDRFVDVVVRLDIASASPISVGYTSSDSTAFGSTDYVYPGGTLNFAAGETSKTVRIQLRDDSLAEKPETFEFVLRDPVNATLSRSRAQVNIVDNDTLVQTPSVYVSDIRVDEKQGTASFVVRLGHNLGHSASGPVSVNFATQDGTAVAGQDFVARNGTLTFAPGESVKTVVVDLIDDSLAEPLERFGLVLSTPTNATIGDGLAQAEISLSDGLGSVLPRLGVADLTAGEGDGYFNVVVTLHAPSANPVSVGYTVYDSTAFGSTDYVYPGGTLNFAPGETSKTVQVQLRDDAVAEKPETFEFYLRDVVNATLSRSHAQINIFDNDTLVETPSVYVSDVRVDEKQGTASFIVRLGHSLGNSANDPISVNIATQDGTAVAGQDFIAKSGTLTFAPGESVKTVVVDLIDDSLAEPLERFSLLLSAPANADIGDGVAQAEISLSDGVGSALPRLSVADLTAGEGDGYFNVVVTLHAPSANPVSVGYTVSDSTAFGSTDYVYPGGTLNFAPGETSKTVQVQLRDDLSVEGPESFQFYLRDVVNATISRGTAEVTIIDNDSLVEQPHIFVDDVRVDEAQGTARFVVRLGLRDGESSPLAVTVNYATQDDSASARQDYLAQSGVISFAPGETVKTVVVDLIDDGFAEPLERFGLQLSNPVNAALGDGSAVAEISQNSGTGTALPRLSVADLSVGEADGFADVVVKLSAASTSAVSVFYYTGNASALHDRDVIGASHTLSFAPGEASKTVRLPIINDSVAEGTESLRFSLQSASNATLGRESALISIIDNDSVSSTPRLFVDDVSVDEQAGTASFVVRLGQTLGESSTSMVTVQYATGDGTGIAGQDYSAKTGTLSFAPGESTKTVVVDLVDDKLAEPLERFNLLLTLPVNAVLGDGAAVAEIGASDDIAVAQPRISADDISVGESDRHVDVVVRLSAPSAGTVTVAYRTVDATAGDVADYRATSGTLSFAPGETTATVRIELSGNAVAENQETFNFVLSSPTGASLASSTARINIVDDDRADGRSLLSQGRSNDLYIVDKTTVDFLELAGGGFDVVRSSVSFTLPAQLEGLILTGTASTATGNESGNFFQGNAANNVVNGLGGIDTMAFAGGEADCTVSGTLASRTVNSATEGSDTLQSIERLQFANTIRAYDTAPGGNTWAAYAVLNAAFNTVPSTALLSQWTVQMDQLGNARELARAMIQYYAPGVSNEALVSHLWSTIIGTPLSPADLATYVGLINNGSFTQASLLEYVSTLQLNTDEFTAIVGQPVALDPAWFPFLGG